MCQTRAEGLGLEAVVADEDKFVYGKDVCGVLVQYPATDGTVSDYKVGPRAQGTVEDECRANVEVGQVDRVFLSESSMVTQTHTPLVWHSC